MVNLIRIAKLKQLEEDNCLLCEDEQYFLSLFEGLIFKYDRGCSYYYNPNNRDFWISSTFAYEEKKKIVWGSHTKVFQNIQKKYFLGYADTQAMGEKLFKEYFNLGRVEFRML